MGPILHPVNASPSLHYTQFTSLFFKNICEIFRIDKTQTTAFHPQSDGLVERFNRTIEDMLSKAVSDLYYAIQLSKPKIVHHDRLKAYLWEPKTSFNLFSGNPRFSCVRCNSTYDTVG